MCQIRCVTLRILLLILIVALPNAIVFGQAHMGVKNKEKKNGSRALSEDQQKVARLRSDEVQFVVLDGMAFNDNFTYGPYENDGIVSSVRSPFVIADTAVTAAFIKAFRSNIPLPPGADPKMGRTLYGGPPNYVFFALKTPKNGERQYLEFQVQPQDIYYDGPQFQIALDSAKNYLAHDCAKKAKALRGNVQYATVDEGYSFETPRKISDPKEIEALLQGLQRLDLRAFAFNKNSSLLAVRFTKNDGSKEMIRLRPAIWDFSNKLYPGVSLDMLNPPVPWSVWRYAAPKTSIVVPDSSQ